MIDLVLAVLFDWLIGDPPAWPHPVKLMGRLIAAEERWVRAGAQRVQKQAARQRVLVAGGGAMVLLNLGLTFGLLYLLLRWLQAYPVLYHPVRVYLLYTCLAARSLRDEAFHVSRALRRELEAARTRLGLIVGRDTGQLDEPEIIRATVETVAENTADGVIAPLLYAMVGGAPLAVAYKMVNTMDSMLGYRHETYRHIGLIPARADDVFNYLPARLTGGLLILGGLLPAGRFAFHVRPGWRIMRRDHRNHQSPNCGYPEAAAAGLLGVQLGGDNWYFGQLVRKPTIGDRTRALEQADIGRGVALMVRAELAWLIMAGILRWQGIGTL